MPSIVEGESPQVELQNAHSQTPYIPCVTIVLSLVQICVYPLWAHVRDGSNGGVAGIHCLREDSRDPKVGYLHLALRIDEQIGGLDVPMNNPPSVEVAESGENLAGEIREGGFVRHVGPFQRSSVHVLEEDLNLAIVIGQTVAFNHVGVVDVAEDLDLATHLEADGVLVVAVNHLQSIELARRTVEDLVDRAAAPTPDAVDALQLGEGERSR